MLCTPTNIASGILPALAAVMGVFSANISLAQERVNVPVIETIILSQIELGVKRSGTVEKIVTINRKVSETSSGSSSTTSTQRRVLDNKSTRTRKTNVERRKSRPKPSGLISGIARAFGGDYSGLVTFGAGFLDHMAEPKFITDISQTAFVQDFSETVETSVISSSWERQNDFENKVTQRYIEDIAKGYIKFAVGVTNAGSRNISIQRPNFVVFLEAGSAAPHLLGQDLRPSSPSEVTFHDIAPGGTHTFSVSIDGLDFIDLTARYRSATGIRVQAQDLIVRRPDGASEAISALHDRVRNESVRLDYYDGTHREVSFIGVDSSGILVDDFIKVALSDKNYKLASTESPSYSVEEKIISVSDLDSNESTLSELSDTEKPMWRRWFVTVADDNGVVFNANGDDRIFPGYSMQVGYYAADQILQPSDYRPVVFSRSDIAFKPNEVFQIPIELKQGDVIAFENIRFGAIRTNTASFAVEKIAPGTSVNGFSLADGHYLITPESSQLEVVNPAVFIQPAPGVSTALSVRENVGSAMVWTTFLNHLRESFTLTDDLGELEPSPLSDQISISEEGLGQTNDKISLIQRPGESFAEAFYRSLSPDDRLEFSVAQDIAPSESRWVFYMPTMPVKAIVASSPSPLPDRIHGVWLSNGYSYRSALLMNGPALPMYGGVFGAWGSSMPHMQDVKFQSMSGSPVELQPVIVGGGGGDSLTALTPTGAPSLTLESTFGAQATADLIVLRYSK